jgi:tetratricopeptide (TPR) repeat protein
MRRLAPWLLLATLAGAPDMARAEAASPSRSALLGMLHQGDFARLEAHFSELRQAEEGGEITDAATLRALAAFESADPALEARLDAWVSDDPKSLAAHLARAVHYRHLGRMTAPGPGDGQDEGRSGHFKQARADLVIALGLASTPGVPYALLVDLATADRDTANADRLARAGLAAAPKSYAVRRAYLRALKPWRRTEMEPARVLADLEAFTAEVAAAAQETPVLEPLRGFRAFVMAESLRQQRRHAQAEHYYEAALGFGADWEYLRQRGANAFAAQRYADALTHLDAALALRPESPSLLDWRARTQHALGNNGAAIADWVVALALDPWNPAILLHRAEALRDFGRAWRAKADLDRAVRYGRRDPRVRAARGSLTLVELRKPRAAVPDLRQAAELEPGNAEHWYSFARALHSLRACEAPKALAVYQGLCEKGARCQPRGLDWAREALRVYDDPFICPAFGMIGP